MVKKYLIQRVMLLAGLLLTSCGVTRNATLAHLPNTPIQREYPRLTFEQQDSLLALYGNNKIFIEEFLEPTLAALAAYPELQDSPIEFKYSTEATTMAARPKPLSMLWRRRYVVAINNDESFEGIHLKDIPFNAQVGIIGHELAHIADYENHNFFGVTAILFRYASPSRKPLYEKEIDRATIERGLGWQLHDWAEFSLDEANGSTHEYIEFKKKHYLTPSEIVQHIDFFGRYFINY